MMLSHPQTPRLFFLPENEREGARLAGEKLQTSLANPPPSPLRGSILFQEIVFPSLCP